MTLKARFFAKVVKSEGCWTWTAFIDKAGYARIGSGRVVLYGHRVSYEMHHGPIPTGMVVDHKCRNRSCVNPEHLHIVTRKQNHENLGGPNATNKSTRIRNVYLHKPSGRWYVRVGHAGRSYYGGYFNSVELAEQAARALRNRLHTNNLKDRESA